MRTEVFTCHTRFSPASEQESLLSAYAELFFCAGRKLFAKESSFERPDVRDAAVFCKGCYVTIEKYCPDAASETPARKSVGRTVRRTFME